MLTSLKIKLHSTIGHFLVFATLHMNRSMKPWLEWGRIGAGIRTGIIGIVAGDF